MKYTSKSLILLALTTFIATMLACAVPAMPFSVQITVPTAGTASPQLLNIHMTTDDTGSTPAVFYSPKQSFFVFLDPSGIQIGSLIEAKWYSVNVPGVSPNTLINVSDYTYETGVEHVHFRLNATGGGQWPTGSYKVEIYLNGVKAGEVPFYVN